jgi:hypothetical protein
MERHWTLTLVAVAGILGGFLLAVGSQSSVLSGPVVAASVFALVVPEFVDAADPAR